MTPYQTHKQSWIECRKCLLCKKRKHVVLARGRVPCDVLFIGEAPGASEDVLGVPFAGPAGHLLDKIIANSLGYACRVAMTNLVACIPVGDEGSKTAEPPGEAIAACKPRLQAFVNLCRPRLIVCVGKLATKWVPWTFEHWREDCRRVDVVHPAAILRMEPWQRGLAVQRATLAICDALEDVL